MRTANVQKVLDESDLLSIPRGLVKNESKMLKEGDLLVSTANSWNLVGKCCWVPSLSYQATAGGFIAILRGDDKKIDRRYLYHWFSTPDTQLNARNCGRQTTNISNMDINRCLALEVPLPALPEQRRIAAILDKADALRAKRREAIAKLDQLLQSVFRDMFGNPITNPKSWQEGTFGEMFDISSSKRVLESQWRKDGVPFYRAREIIKLAKHGAVDNDLFISEALFEELAKKSGAPEAGDLMVSAVGTLGSCYQVQEGDRFYFKDASVLRFRPRGNVDPTFVQFAFGTEHVLRQVHSGSGSTVGTYTISRAKETRLYVPPLELQQKFASLVRSVRERKVVLSSSLLLNEALFESLQSNAFSRGI
jgi:type I restriction enzyme S subunit